MDKRSDIPLRVMVAASAAARRKELKELVTHGLARVIHLTVEAQISIERFVASGSEIQIADLETPAAASSLLNFLDVAPAGTGTIAFVDEPDPVWVRAALRRSINAILARDAGPEDLQLAFQAAEGGLVLLHPTSARALTTENLSRGADEVSTEEVATEELTGRECQILRLVSAGFGNKEIAARLTISEHTVKFHISSILSKLNAASRTEAVSLGIRRGIIPI